MSIEIRVPDIGDFDAVDVVEVLIAPGDTVAKEQSVLVLESDKASMEVPSEVAGVVSSVAVNVGEQVKEGDLIAVLTAAEAVADAPSEPVATAPPQAAMPDSGAVGVMDLLVPDIGDFDKVDVIEVNVAVGDEVVVEQGLITLESDKASMEVPAPQNGKIVALTVEVGAKVASGDVIGQLQVATSVATTEAVAATTSPSPAAPAPKTVADSAIDAPVAKQVAVDEVGFSKAHASPSVRKFARELGADLAKIKGSGRKGRILEADVKGFIKQALQADKPSATVLQAGTGIPPIPEVDFSQFGQIEKQKLSRINVLTGEAMTRNWLNIPHVTQHELADITELEAFRQSLKAEAEKNGVRVTMLAFLMKALVAGLKEMPRFNTSLSADGKELIVKKYYNIGIAVDTPNGLVVPVIRGVDQKGIFELSSELMNVSQKARDGKLTPKDMSGGSMTISSLGGIGGQYFTPIVNAPEVAILGVSRSLTQPVWNGSEFKPRLMLPLSLSYDHRVIDGALGARMVVFLARLLADMKRIML